MKYLDLNGLTHFWEIIKNKINTKVDASGGDSSNTVIKTMDAIATDFPVPAAGESTKTFAGKVKKFMTDFNSFKTGIITVGKLANNFQTTSSGMALDARAGKTLNDLVTKLNQDIVGVSSDIDAVNADFIKKPGVATIDNIDTLSPGYYTIDSLAMSGISNSAWGSLMVMQRSNGDRQQIFCSNGSGDQTIFYRVKNNNTWQDWKRVVLTSDFQQKSDTPGYVKLPTGLILQWGYATYPANVESVEITIPTSFAKAMMFGIASSGYNNSLTNFFSINSSGVSKVVIRGQKSDGSIIAKEETVKYFIIGI